MAVGIGVVVAAGTRAKGAVAREGAGMAPVAKAERAETAAERAAKGAVAVRERAWAWKDPQCRQGGVQVPGWLHRGSRPTA